MTIQPSAANNGANPPVIGDALDSDANALQNPSAQELQEQLDEVRKERDELKEKHSANRKGIDDYSAKVKNLNAEIARLKILADEEETIIVPPAEESQFVTKEDLWLRDNQSRIELVKDEYEELMLSGKLDKEYALELAESRAKIQSPEPRIPVTGRPSIDRSGDGDTKCGVPITVYQKWKSKGLTDDQIKRIIPESLARAAKMGKISA